MRKVILTMNEEFTYQYIKRFVDQGGNFNALCLKLDCSTRTARRKIAFTATWKMHAQEPI